MPAPLEGPAVEELEEFSLAGEEPSGMAMLVRQKTHGDARALMAQEKKNMTEEEKQEFNERSMQRFREAEVKLEAKRAAEGPVGPLEIRDGAAMAEEGDYTLRPNQIMINGQIAEVARSDQKAKVIAKLQKLDVSEVQLNLMKVNLLKILKKSKWAEKFKHLEINEDPIMRWTTPIVRISTEMRFQYAFRSLVRMNNYVTRCKVLNPDNEDAIDECRLKLEAKMFLLKKLTECDEEYGPIFEITRRGLKATQARLDQMLAGMAGAGSDSEASVSSDCQEDAMEQLRVTRKQMAFTMASVM